MSSAFGPTGRGASVTVSVKSGRLTGVMIVTRLCVGSAVPSAAVRLKVVVSRPGSGGAVTVIKMGCPSAEPAPIVATTAQVTMPPGVDPVWTQEGAIRTTVAPRSTVATSCTAVAVVGPALLTRTS